MLTVLTNKDSLPHYVTHTTQFPGTESYFMTRYRKTHDPLTLLDLHSPSFDRFLSIWICVCRCVLWEACCSSQAFRFARFCKKIRLGEISEPAGSPLRSWMCPAACANRAQIPDGNCIMYRCNVSKVWCHQLPPCLFPVVRVLCYLR